MFYSEMLRIETGIIVPYEERAQTLPFYNNTGKFNLEYLRKLDCLIILRMAAFQLQSGNNGLKRG